MRRPRKTITRLAGGWVIAALVTTLAACAPSAVQSPDSAPHSGGTVGTARHSDPPADVAGRNPLSLRSAKQTGRAGGDPVTETRASGHNAAAATPSAGQPTTAPGTSAFTGTGSGTTGRVATATTTIAPATGPTAGDVSTTLDTCDSSAATPTAPVSNYRLAGCADFNGTTSTHFSPYTGVNDSVVGKGAVPSQCEFRDGQLIERQAADGATCAGSTDFSSVYGLWEIRMRAFSTGDGPGSQPNPVLLLWPDNDDWSEGEIDFFETSLGSQARGYLHCVGSDPRRNCYMIPASTVDYTDYHVYSILWQPGRLTEYIDGTLWWTTTLASVMPSHPMHLTIQLDNDSRKLPVVPGEMDVDWVHFYRAR